MNRKLVADILDHRAHRPWPMPSGPWVMYQSWQRQLFAHWSVPPEALRALVPPELELDTFHGHAYVGVTPFDLCGLQFRLLPRLPVGSDFPETNVRTYVTVNGKPGVFFLSLDAASVLAVSGARLGFRLPYYVADMRIAEHDEWIEYYCKRQSSGAELRVRYRSNGPVFTAARDSLDHFLVERYALYVVLESGRVMRGDIHHMPWRLQHAVAHFERNGLAEADGIVLPDTRPVLHFSNRQDTLIWPLVQA